MGLASRRRYRWTGGRISDYWDEVFTADGFEGQRRARRPVRVHREPGHRPVRPDARRARHHPGRPGRDHPRRVARRARRRRRSGHRQDRRRAAPHGLPAVLRPAPRAPARRRAVRRPAPAVPGLRLRRAAEPRRGGRADLHAARPGRRRAPTRGGRDRPGGGPAEVVRGDGDGDRAGRPVLREAADAGHARSRRRGRTSGSAPTTGPRRSRRPNRARRTTRRATRSATRCSRSSWTRSTDDDVERRPAAPRAAAATRTSPRALNRAWPLLEPTDLVGDLWSVPAYLRLCAPVARRSTEVRPLQRDGRAGLDGVRPAAPRRRPAAARRPRGVPAPTPARGHARRRARVHDAGRRPPDRDRRLRAAASCRCCAGQDMRDKLVDEAALPTADPDAARRPVRARRRRRGAGADRRGVADAAAAAARRGASPSSATARRPGTGSPSRGRSGSSGSGSTAIELASLSINYRTPEEVMAEAEPVIRAALPGRQRADVDPRQRRPRGARVRRPTCDAILDAWLAAHDDGHRLRHRRPDLRRDRRASGR